MVEAGDATMSIGRESMDGTDLQRRIVATRSTAKASAIAATLRRTPAPKPTSAEEGNRVARDPTRRLEPLRRHTA
jgi:hypothetical protein